MQTNTSRDRLGSEGVRGITSLLRKATNGRCAICADAVQAAKATDPKREQVSHVRPALGSRREGWASGNLFLGCGECNDRTGSRDLSAAVHLFRIPSGVIAWTDAEARREGRSCKTNKTTTGTHATLWASIDATL